MDVAEKIEDLKESLDETDNKQPSPKVVQEVTERVYQMLLQDLVIERERHRLANPYRRFNV